MRCDFFRIKIELRNLIKDVVLKIKIAYIIDNVIDNVEINTIDDIDNVDFFDIIREVKNKNINNIDNERK